MISEFADVMMAYGNADGIQYLDDQVDKNGDRKTRLRVCERCSRSMDSCMMNARSPTHGITLGAKLW